MQNMIFSFNKGFNMKPRLSFFAIIFSLFSFFSYAEDDISQLKKQYYEESGYQEQGFDGRYAIEYVESSQRDINGDGVNEVIFYHGEWDCGSGGCTGIVYFRNNNDYCVIGSGDVANFDAIINKPREYKCLDGKESALIGNDGEQIITERVDERVVDDPNLQNPFLIESLFHKQINYLNITSKVDDIDVLDVEANRGNCSLHIGSAAMFPVKLKYGQNFKVMVMYCSTILELKIKTNYGDYIYPAL